MIAESCSYDCLSPGSHKFAGFSIAQQPADFIAVDAADQTRMIRTVQAKIAHHDEDVATRIMLDER